MTSCLEIQTHRHTTFIRPLSNSCPPISYTLKEKKVTEQKCNITEQGVPDLTDIQSHNKCLLPEPAEVFVHSSRSLQEVLWWQIVTHVLAVIMKDLTDDCAKPCSLSRGSLALFSAGLAPS